ncbi:MAG: hypothetical protein ABFE07_02135 [Armatimonadia bacterium]
MLKPALLSLPLPLLLLLASSVLAAGTAGKPSRPSVRPSPQGLILENATCRYEIGANGRNLSFGPPGGRNYCEPDKPAMLVSVNGKTCEATQVSLSGDTATVRFGDSGPTAKVRLQAMPTHLAMTVTEVQGDGVQWLQVCNLRLQLSESVGTLVNAAWDSSYGACVMACNDLSEAYGADQAQAALCARCHAEYGMVGARFAIIGVPTGRTEPDVKVLEAIGKMELAEGLPHPLVNGVWLKQSPERFRSYLMVHDLSEANVDQVVEAARGGFGCIEFYPWRSTPSYQLNPKAFPHGMDGLKAVCGKIHAAGMQVGLHTMQSMVGWGPKDDPAISPKADARLLQDKRGTLAAALDEQTTTLALQDGTKGWPEHGVLFAEGELIGYEKRTDSGFEGVKRGLYGTTVSTHPAGASVGNMVNCFPIWGNTVFCPDLKTNMVDEVCQRIADLFNAVGCDMSYFDAGEELAKQPPAWHNQGIVALGVMKRLEKPIVLEGNALYTNLSWHVITRGSPHFDPISFGRREYTLRFKGINPAGWRKNLLTGDVGWFAPHGWSLATDAVTPDEVMLLCLKATGGKAPISFSISAAAVKSNPRMPEMLEIIRACDELKRTDYFTPEARAELTRPRTEWSLEQTPRGDWNLRPMQFGPPQVVNAADSSQSRWECNNPYPSQQPFVRLRARPKLAAYGDASNKVLADFAKGELFKPEATASADLTQSVGLSGEKAPDGSPALCYRIENKGVQTSKWMKISYPLAAQVDLSQHRRLGLWLKANGCGGIANLQLVGKDARRDHYIPLSFSDWRYIELTVPEETRFWDHSWPYPWTDLFYTCWSIYNATKQLDIYLNALPAGAKAECLIGRIEALKEIPAAVKSPTLEASGSKVVFPVSLQPEEYLEMDFYGRCRQFDRNGKALADVTPQGALELGSGNNKVLFSCTTEDDASARAEVTLMLRGEPLKNAHRAKVKTAKYEGLTAPQ